MKSRKMVRFMKKSEPYRYLLPTIFLMVVLLAIPIFMVIRFAFFDNVIVNANPKFVGFANFVELFQDEDFWTAIRNTLVFVCISVVAHMFLGILFAMLLNTRYLGSRTKAFFRVIYVLPWVFTASVIAILWVMIMNPNGILNYFLDVLHLSQEHIEWLGSRKTALTAVTFINIWSGYPFYMISILAGLQGISSDLYEAAAIDGANTPNTFFRITIPQLKPILISLLMLDFIWTFQQFALIWMTTGGGPINATEMMSTYIYKWAFSKFQYSMASAAACIVLIFCVILAIFYVRQQQKARD